MSVSSLLKSPALDPNFQSYLRLVEPYDAAFVCQLRADPALNRHLSPSPNDVLEQTKWIERYKEREKHSEEYYFVISSNETDFGVIRMYDFRSNPRSFSWGSWIVKPERPAGLVTFSAVMIYEIGFDTLGFEQAHFDVRKGNSKVINFHLRSGAIEAGETDLDRLFIFPKAAWSSFREKSAGQLKSHRVLCS
ncbi:GNAT family N-acetyltransferase [Leisingera sp. M527]|uniref:GNAT family N-acetyltransferase n=1 Tax=Leisingera sp. M527 TaxID=2867014 RepID=UPI0021A63485|nr:GNAT family N-acetyltransferase [Leisingera sp. M527]UWQ31989.1 GNAT family N-acetyltransferase [Leisingera sp. M527]